VYNETNWVAYMTDDVKTGRKARYQALNLRAPSTGPWTWPTLATTMACLMATAPTAKIISARRSLDPMRCRPGGSIDDLSDDVIAGWLVHCRAQYTLEALSGLLSEAMTNFTNLMADGYDSKFKVYSKSVAPERGYAGARLPFGPWQRLLHVPGR